MEKNTKSGIQHLGSALALICRITRLVFSMTGILGLIGSVVSLFAPNLIEFFEGLYRQNILYQILTISADIGSMEEKYAAAAQAAHTVSLVLRRRMSYSGRKYTKRGALNSERASYTR